MEFIKKYPENMDAKTQYKLIRSPEIKKMSDCVDSILEVVAFVRYTDTDRTGEEKDVLSLMTDDMELIATTSPSFIREFDAITEIFGDDFGTLKVVGGRSKNGRNFITCTIE